MASRSAKPGCRRWQPLGDARPHATAAQNGKSHFQRSSRGSFLRSASRRSCQPGAVGVERVVGGSATDVAAPDRCVPALLPSSPRSAVPAFEAFLDPGPAGPDAPGFERPDTPDRLIASASSTSGEAALGSTRASRIRPRKPLSETVSISLARDGPAVWFAGASARSRARASSRICRPAVPVQIEGGVAVDGRERRLCSTTKVFGGRFMEVRQEGNGTQAAAPEQSRANAASTVPPRPCPRNRGCRA
ncbi:hypothetical protein GGR04_004192 [Aureimonas pseudogalii]|uniref:Uncharacterized protein n=1 Tax=Aureimonas pseudogalii TaxID=1744844 RepID=A0A7W6MM08_9HYPH|nr:hypothetical protein [Aureimonas pseudogalii]